jgi:Ca2+-binding RTX toxin-like protein
MAEGGQMPVVSDYTAIVSGTSWWGTATPGKPIFLTYSFNTAVQPYVAGFFEQDFLDSFTPLTSDDMTLARNALSQWADASGITFFEVPAGEGDLQFGKYDFNAMASTTGYSGFANFPYGPGEFDLSGDIFLTSRRTLPLQIFLHEIGHALGLKHSFAEPNLLPANLDNWGQTVMSYTSGGFSGSTLGPLDLQAIRSLYGAPDRDGTQVASWSWDSAQYILTQVGGAAADTIHGVHVGERIHGGSGNDVLLADAGNDELYGEDGNDRLYGGNGDDSAFGGAGTDTIFGEAAAIQWLGNDILYGGDDDDTIYGERGVDEPGGADQLFGENGDDKLYGDGGDDSLAGGAGNDALNGGAGSNTLTGGDGIDTAAFSGALFDYTISQTGTSTIISGSGGTDTLTGIEQLTFNDITIMDAAHIIVLKCIMPVRTPEFISFAEPALFGAG